MSQTDLDSATLVRMLRDRLHQQTELCVKAEDENAKLRELLDFALPIAMYAASMEEGDRIREMMREVDV